MDTAATYRQREPFVDTDSDGDRASWRETVERLIDETFATIGNLMETYQVSMGIEER
jgi:hypothetical protein